MMEKRQIDIMGIVNLTDDSFYAGSRCGDAEAALDLIAMQVDEGADIVDIGACSTRPGSMPIGAEQEWSRLKPVLELLRGRFPDLRVSIDTYWSSVVERAYDVIGDFIVNDISAGEDDPEMLDTVGRLGLEYVAMHKRGTPATMQSMIDYQDIVEEVRQYFLNFSRRAAEAGVDRWILDPGFGFAKTVEQNYLLLAELDSLACAYGSHTPRILVGVSRKSMIYKPLNITPEESLPATQAVHMAALMKGADILRVHDVKEAGQTVLLYNKVQGYSADVAENEKNNWS